MNGRDYLQLVTLSLTFLSILLTLVCWKRRTIGWGYLAILLIYLLQVAVFYIVVLIRHAPPSEIITSWSSAIRLFSLVIIVMGLYIVASKDAP